MSDTVMFLTIICVFVVIGGLLPYIQTGLGQSSTDLNIMGLKQDLGQAVDGDITVLNATPTGFAVMTSILKMFFWSFGSLPFWLDLIFLIPRMMLVLLFVRLLRGQ